MRRRLRLAGALVLVAACGPPKIWTGTSPDHRTGYEVFERDGRTCVRVADREPRCFDGVALAGVVFSADSRSLAYPATDDGAWFVVHDGRPGPPFDGIGDLVLAPDGRRLAYAAATDGRWRVVVDGRPGPPVDSIFHGSLTLDASGRRVAYVAADGGRAAVIVDGARRATHDGVADLRFAPDGRRVAWVARDGNRSALVVDGAAGRRHDGVGAYAFGPDGRVAYLARDEDGWWLRGWDAPSGPHVGAHSLAFDGDVPTFVARETGGERVVRGTSAGPRFAEVDPPVFAPGRWGYVGRDSAGSTVVLDGEPRVVDGWSSDLAFDDQGRRHAYLVRRDDADLVVHDRGSERFDVVARGTLHFTSAGCWAALVGGWSDRGLRVVVEGGGAARPFDWWDFAPAALGGRRGSEEEATAALRAWVAAEAELILEERGGEAENGSLPGCHRRPSSTFPATVTPLEACAMTPPSVALVVDDEPHIRRAVGNALSEDFDRIVEAGSATEAVDLAAAHRPDVIVLDLGLPDKPGRWVCEEIRKWSTVPILVLSARHSEGEKIRLLDEGADDYITKPFHPGELLARVRAQVRRARMGEVPGEGTAVTIDGLVIDTAARTVKREGEDVHLTPTEWELLRAFLRHAGKTLTHRQLFRSVWAASSGDPRQYLRVYVANLRRKLEPDSVRPRLIITEPGVGYRFELSD